MSLPNSVIVELQTEMQRAGYLSRAAIDRIAAQFGLSPTAVYATASFYQQFSFTPKGQNVIAVCTGTACFINGAPEILSMLQNEFGLTEGGITADGKFSLEKNTRCLGQCADAPVVRINETIYPRATVDQIREVLNGLRQR